MTSRYLSVVYKKLISLVAIFSNMNNFGILDEKNGNEGHQSHN